jgi:alpha-L-fucosidase
MKKIILTLTAIWSVSVLWAQGDVYEKSEEYEWPDDAEVVRKLKDWQDLKFGVLIHWGLYAVPGIVE